MPKLYRITYPVGRSKMATQLRINDIQIKSLKPALKPHSKHYGGGFTVKVYPNGRKVVYYTYQHDGKRRSYQLGEYGPAAMTLKQLKDEYYAAVGARKGVERIDPAANRKAAAQKKKHDAQKEKAKEYTVSKLVDDFIEHYKVKGNDKLSDRTRKEYSRGLQHDVIPVLGNVPAEEVTRIQLKTLIENKALTSMSMANRTLAVFQSMFGWWSYRTEHPNPALGIKRVGKENPRERALSEDEIRIFWSSLDRVKTWQSNLIKMILLTGQRPGEVSGMRWDEIQNDIWILPPHRVKNKNEHRVPVTEMMKQHIPAEREGAYVYPNPKNGKPITMVMTYMRPVVKSLDMEHFTGHDLRRTMATQLGELGYLDEEIGLILNHARKGQTKTYNKARYDERKRKMLEHWHQHLQTILSGEQSSNVVEMRKGVEA